MFTFLAEKLPKYSIIILLFSQLAACYDPKVSRYGAMPVDFYYQYTPPNLLAPQREEAPEAMGYGKYPNIKNKQRYSGENRNYPSANHGYFNQYGYPQAYLHDKNSPKYYSKYNSTY